MKNNMFKQLKTYVQENNLHEKAMKDFWVAFNNWKEESPEEYRRVFKDILIDDLDVFIHYIGLRSAEWPNCERNHVTVTIFIHHEDFQLGYYAWWHSLDGDDDDDFLVIN